jgi:hypothetical protein
MPVLIASFASMPVTRCSAAAVVPGERRQAGRNCCPDDLGTAMNWLSVVAMGAQVIAGLRCRKSKTE